MHKQFLSSQYLDSLWPAGGIQRFYLGQIGMGILYLFTYGLCLIGTIMDLVNNKSLTNEFNQKAAQEVAMMMRI